MLMFKSVSMIYANLSLVPEIGQMDSEMVKSIAEL